MSGLETISISATPERLRSTKLIVGCWSWIDLPASCSRCRRSMPTVKLLGRRQVDDDLALADDRALVLADLVALRQVRVEIVLPVEDRAEVDLRLEPEAGAHRLAHAFLVDHGQHAGHGRVDEADTWLFGPAPNSGRGPGKQLGVGGHLRMDLQSPSRP
jgi:hypothetical protein